MHFESRASNGSLSYEAMIFAREVHKNQKCKYTGNPYVHHLAEVAGIAMSAGWHISVVHPHKIMAVCWLHDCMEDQGVETKTLCQKFGYDIAESVMLISDFEAGNRDQRKVEQSVRISNAPGWLQTIKCADLISNTPSVLQHDPKFAETYLEKNRLLLEVMTKADRRLLAIAREQMG